MNMKWNMALAAIVLAGIIAWLSGFISQHAVHAEQLSKDAVTIQTAESSGSTTGAAAKAGPEPILEHRCEPPHRRLHARYPSSRSQKLRRVPCVN